MSSQVLGSYDNDCECYIQSLMEIEEYFIVDKYIKCA